MIFLAMDFILVLADQFLIIFCFLDHNADLAISFPPLVMSQQSLQLLDPEFPAFKFLLHRCYFFLLGLDLLSESHQGRFCLVCPFFILHDLPEHLLIVIPQVLQLFFHFVHLLLQQHVLVLRVEDFTRQGELDFFLLEGVAAPGAEPCQGVADVAELVGARILQSLVFIQDGEGVFKPQLEANRKLPPSVAFVVMKAVLARVKINLPFGKEMRDCRAFVWELIRLIFWLKYFFYGEFPLQFVGGAFRSHQIKDLINKIQQTVYQVKIQIMSHQVDPRKVREISLAEKKEIIWNVIEPGDPYDIRKSMIAQLPGQRKFMGPHLELVCLLQAAEIQRLCLYLEEHRLKLRESERVVLDRHSYQVQIKQLSEKLLMDEGLRNENIKLKQFIRRQSKELEEIQRQQDVSEITKNYESSLTQVQQLIYQKTQLKLAIEQLQSQVTAHQETIKYIQQGKLRELQALQAKLKQQFLLKEQQKDRKYQQLIEEKVYQDEQRSSALQEYQNRFYLLAGEIERLNSCLRDKSKEINEQTIRYQQLNDEKKYREEQNLELQSRIRALSTDIDNLERKNREAIRQKSTYEHRQTVIRQNESRIEKLSIEVDRLNGVLRKKINELDEYRKRVRDQELSISNFQLVERETDELRAKFSQVSKKLFEYQKQATVQNQEIDRLNMTLKRMVEQISYAETKLKSSEKQLDSQIKKCLILENDLDQHTKSHNELRQTNRAIIAQLREENQHLKNKMLNFQRIYEENNVLKAEIEQRVAEKEETTRKFSQKIEDYQREVELLNEKILHQQEELNQKSQAKEYIDEISNLKEELFRMNSERSNLNEAVQKLAAENQLLNSENEQQRRKVEELGEYYRKVIIFNEEINRLNAVISTREKEIQACHDSLLEYQQKIKYLEESVNLITFQLQQYKREPHQQAKIQDYQEQIQVLRIELQKSREKDQKISTYQSKITVIGSEIERLNAILKQKLQKIQQLQDSNKQLKQQNNELKQQFNHPSSHDKLVAEYDRRINEQRIELQRVLAILRQREDELQSLSQEYTRGRQNSNNQIARIAQKLASYQQNITNYLKQIDRLNRILQDNSTQIYKIESKDQDFVSQIERLNNLLRIKIEECESKTLDLKKYSLEIDELKDQLNEERSEKQMINHHKEMFSQEVVKAKQQMYTYEARIKELYEEFQRLQIVMKTLKEENQNIAALHQQIQDLIQKNRWLGSQIDKLNQTIEAQDRQLKEVRLTFSDHSSLQNRVNQDLGLMVLLFAEIESLRRRIEERDQQAREMRRSNVMQFRV